MNKSTRVERPGQEIDRTCESEERSTDMIRPHIFKVDSLITALFKDDMDNNPNWRRLAEIIPAYRGMHANPATPTKCVIRLDDRFLRHSKGPRQGHFWDIVGDDYHSPELAFVALLEAEPPCWLIKEVTYDEPPPEEAA